jgi:hypothetical protein
MTKIPTFHSIHEASKPEEHRVHHDNNACHAAEAIPHDERVPGTGGYRLCHVCHEENLKGH